MGLARSMLLQYTIRPFIFIFHSIAGVIDVLRGGSWRSSISSDTETAYMESVWREGSEELSERDRHFHQVGATFRGKRITDAQHEELCKSVTHGLMLDETVRKCHTSVT